MTVLSDQDVRARLKARSKGIGIKPCKDSQVQPASVDLTLANEFSVFPQPHFDSRFESEFVIDMEDAKKVPVKRFVSNEWHLEPGELVLCSTAEYVEIPSDIQAQVHGESSLGRLGLLVHATAGFIDPGFKGNITLEMYNLNKRSIVLRAGKSICQLSFALLSSPAEFPYGHPKLKSKYQNQKGVQGSLYAG
jgi:dCTP deaminase